MSQTMEYSRETLLHVHETGKCADSVSLNITNFLSNLTYVTDVSAYVVKTKGPLHERSGLFNNWRFLNCVFY